MALTYATAGEFMAALPDDVTIPADIPTLLTYASRLVRAATKTAIYDTTSTGAPTDPDVAAAFRDATVAQAVFWASAGVDPSRGILGLPVMTGGSSIGSARIDRLDAAPKADAIRGSLDSLTPSAAAYLADLRTAVWTY